MPNDTYSEVTPRDWIEAKWIGTSLASHVFRGHANAEWHLTTTIERTAKLYSVSPHWLPQHEQTILHEFKSRAHHYLQSVPADSDNVEWLSLIREYGGPTRLLDVTWSFYIASFFAVEEATHDACVWAISTVDQAVELMEKAREQSRPPGNVVPYESLTIPIAESYIADMSKAADRVILITPTRLSERQAIQKGAFLFPESIVTSFEHNLASTFGFDTDAFSKPGTPTSFDGYQDNSSIWIYTKVLKMNLPQKWHKQIIADLYQMNIDAASLLPGLDGFARSLKYPIRMRENTKKAIDEILSSSHPDPQ